MRYFHNFCTQNFDPKQKQMQTKKSQNNGKKQTKKKSNHKKGEIKNKITKTNSKSN